MMQTLGTTRVWVLQSRCLWPCIGFWFAEYCRACQKRGQAMAEASQEGIATKPDVLMYS